MTDTETPNDAVYFLSLSLENVRCFGSRQTLDLSDGHGRPARWTVILGDNGTGKTTLLKTLAGITPISLGPAHGEKTNSIRTPYFYYHYHGPFSDLNDYNFRKNKNNYKIHATILYNTSLTSKNEINPEISIDFDINRDRIEITRTYTLFPTKHNIYAYSANRRLGTISLSQQAISHNIRNLFNDQIELINAEEWLLQEDYTASKTSEIQGHAKIRLELIKDALINILPDIESIRISTPNTANPNPSADFLTKDGFWLKLDDLSLGYQTMIAWMVDLAAHLFQRYPDSKNPIEEPAVVLIDEIDLHLHPKWQRTIMSYLTERFTNTQFIVTAHSPLIVQAAENANIVVLKREGDEVHIHQQNDAVRGWRIDQILNSDLFEQVGARSPHYEELLEKRRKILSKSRLTKADKAKLEALEKEIGDLPTAETPEDIQAMDIIRRAAEILNPKP